MHRPVPIETLEDVRSGDHHLSAICRHETCRYRKDVDVDRLIQRVGARQSLVPARGELHFTDKMRCPSCKRRGINLWLRPNAPTVKMFASASAPKLPNYEIKDWGKEYPHVSCTTIATADNLFIARGAYISAAGFYFDRRITLQQGAFVLGDSKQDGLPEVMTHEDFKKLRALEAGTLTVEELEALAPKAGARGS